MSGLLYETGEPLNRLVRDVFRAVSLNAALTPGGATYDVTVTLPDNSRLLVEVTGIEGYITKASKKISQVLSALQTEAKASDRVVLAVNAYRERPIDERVSLEIVTPDALALLTVLGAVIVTTTDLFTVWKCALEDVADASAKVQSIHAAPPGLLKLYG